MKSIAAALILLFTTIGSAVACSCVFWDPENHFKEAVSVVIAVPQATSIRTVLFEGRQIERQTIVWRVTERFKGPHPKGTTFTSRTVAANNCTYFFNQGDKIVLYLFDREPYRITACASVGPPVNDESSIRKIRALAGKYKNGT